MPNTEDTTAGVVWVTYDELAARRGITRDSAKRLTFRQKWRRTLGNDGASRVGVPVSEAAAMLQRPGVASEVTPTTPPLMSPVATPMPSPPSPPVITAELQEARKHIADLSAALLDERARRIAAEDELAAAQRRVAELEADQMPAIGDEVAALEAARAAAVEAARAEVQRAERAMLEAAKAALERANEAREEARRAGLEAARADGERRALAERVAGLEAGLRAGGGGGRAGVRGWWSRLLQPRRPRL